MGPYSPTDAIGYGFGKFKDNAGAFLLLALVAIGTGIADQHHRVHRDRR